MPSRTRTGESARPHEPRQTALGVLGGTFDPPHLGHLLLAEHAADALALDHVLFVPAADPPHKGDDITPAVHRTTMVALAIAENPRFALSRLDLDRPGPHYTTDLIRLLSEAQPDAALYFLLGSDSLRDFPRWRDPEGIIRGARLGVVRRPGAIIDLAQVAAAVPGIVERVTFVDAPEVGISATSIRERLQAGFSIRYQVPASVAAYIAEHDLYRRYR